MADFSDPITATRAVVDPTTSGADLAQIAQAQPNLWPQIAAHPNAYPDLLTWLGANGDIATKQAVANRWAMTPSLNAALPPLVATTAPPSIPLGTPATVPTGQPTPLASNVAGVVRPPHRRPLLIGAAVLVVLLVVAIVLVIMRPGQAKTPTLTINQLASMIVNSSGPFHQSLTNDSTTPEVVQGIHESTSGVINQLSSACTNISKATWNTVLAAVVQLSA